ncbi:flagellar assembly protein FliX [uncultured Cohaesibacter sp.]|uniref:flagellar assembly protein FliX n=1 Tax=uncultured Cohaesibacter sp. TaxID=1002546 RepID=UPI0029C71114|nr:flagellar assembly protein FliX [uncultured Cohaesibacter sp.]
MRVQGGSGTKHIGKTGSSGASKSSSGSFSVPQDSGETARSQQTSQSSAVQDMSALLALQTVDDALHGKRRKAVRKGNKMLDLLEEIRMGILCGTLSKAVLMQLERLTSEQEPSGDERIDALLEEIGLRAQVEVAKLEAIGEK